MMTRSMAGRFLILAVLLVSLGVIAQAAIIITRKPIARAGTAIPLAAASPGSQTVTDVHPVQAADSAPVRVVYPGPLGDMPMQPRKIADAAPASPLAASTLTGATPAALPLPAPGPMALSTAAAPPAVAAPAAATVPPTPAAKPPAPVQVASTDSAAALPPTDPAPASGKGVNLNSASVDALNHLGGGHIGQTIVQHRPYHSVEDLMKKRVVRRSVFDAIKNQVAAE